MVDIEQLKALYGVNKKGQITVPVFKFDPSWDQELLDLGYECHAERNKVVITKNPDFKKPHPIKTWSKKETDMLIELWNRVPHMKREHIAFRFPDRSLASVVNKLAKLRKAGIIKGRWQTKKTKEKQAKKVADLPVPKPLQPNGMESLKLAGWIFALYVEQQFIEYFKSVEEAKAFQHKHYRGFSVFIKPVAFFSYDKRNA